MQANASAGFPFAAGGDLAGQSALMQGLSMAGGLAGSAQGSMAFMQGQQPIGYPMFDQGMQGGYQATQAGLGMGGFNPMIMNQNMGHQLQGYGVPQNAMNFQMQQQMMNGGPNAAMMGGLGGDPSQMGGMNPYGGMNPQALLAQTLQGAQLQNAYGSSDAMSMIQGMMGNRGQSNFGGDNYNMQGGNNQRFNNNNQNNDTSLRLNTVYVSDLPPNVDHDAIKENFAKVGSIKLNSKSGMPMIWIFKDRGVPKGDALVTYDSNASATNAVAYFKENDFNGSTIDVRIATNAERPILAPPGSNQGGNNNGNKSGSQYCIESVYRHNDYNKGDGYNNWGRNDGGNRQRGGGDFRNTNNSRGNDKNRGPDWMCVKCNNNNFSWRESCNRCQEPKTDDAIEVQDSKRGSRGGMNRGFNAPGSNNRMVHRNTTSRSQDGGPMRGPKKTPSSRPGPY